MLLNDLLTEKKMSRYRLSKESGVPQTTIVDICSGKARIEKCSAETLYKIAKVLQVSMESLIKDKIESKTDIYRNNEKAARESLVTFEQKYPNVVSENNINDIIQNLRKRKQSENE